VLLDGVPLNEAFGGWVYWSRIPLEDASRIEVVDGPSSSLYGNYGMGGVISIVTRRAEHRALEAESRYGSRNNPRLALRAAAVRGRLSAVVDSSIFSTSGSDCDRNRTRPC
jgi:iron complex outermembrane recepter protein